MLPLSKLLLTLSAAATSSWRAAQSGFLSFASSCRACNSAPASRTVQDGASGVSAGKSAVSAMILSRRHKLTLRAQLCGRLDIGETGELKRRGTVRKRQSKRGRTRHRMTGGKIRKSAPPYLQVKATSGGGNKHRAQPTHLERSSTTSPGLVSRKRASIFVGGM